MAKTITSDGFEKWKIKRRWTYWTYVSQSLETGISFAVIATVLWEYLKEVPGSNKKLLYGAMACVYNIPPIAFNVLILKWLDKTRRSKEFIIAVNIISAIGHILFSLPYSPYLLIVGRTLDGFMVTLKPIMASEVSRSYPTDDLQRMLPLLIFSLMIGFSIGPLLSLIFGNVDKQIGNFHLSWGNSCSLMLLSLNIFQIIFVSSFGHNLSLEFDLKESLCQSELSLINDGDDQILEEKPDENGLLVVNDNATENDRMHSNTEKKINAADSTKEVFLKLITKFELALILFISSFSEFWINTLGRIFPVMILDRLHYTKTALSLFFTLYSLAFMLGIYLLGRKKIQNKTTVIIGVVGLINFLIVAECVLFISPKIEKNFNVVLLVVTALTFAISELSETFFASVTFAKMSSSKNQGVGEGIREVFKRVGTIFGSVFALYVYQYMQYTSKVLLVTIVLILVGIFLKRKTYNNPKVMF